MLEEHGLPGHNLGCFVAFLHLSCVPELGAGCVVLVAGRHRHCFCLCLTRGAPTRALVPQELLGTVTGVECWHRGTRSCFGL